MLSRTVTNIPMRCKGCKTLNLLLLCNFKCIFCNEDLIEYSGIKLFNNIYELIMFNTTFNTISYYTKKDLSELENNMEYIKLKNA